MRKIYSKIKSKGTATLALTAIFALLSTENVWGQLAVRYNLAISNGTFSSISGTGTSVAIAADDAAVNVTGLAGFSVNGTSFTSARMCSNGWLALYTTAPTSSGLYTPLSSTLTNGIVVIAPFGADLGVSTAATTAAYRQTIGNEHIFEWVNYSRYNFSGNNDVLNFQVRLNTSTGAITYVYGTCTQGSNPTSSPQVGFRTGSSTTWSTNVNNLMIDVTGSPNTCTWENAVNGNSNTSSMYFNTANSTVKPNSGLTYTWTPQNTVDVVRTFSAASSITTTGATVSWTAPTGGSTYNVQYRTVGSCSWTNWSGNPLSTNSVALTGLTQNTSYQVRVQAVNGGNSTIYSHIPNSAGSGNGYDAAGTFTTLAACSNLPSALTSNTITTTTANIAWTAASPAPGSGYEYFVSTSATAPVSGTTPTGSVGAGIVTAALSSLSVGTQYYFWVRSNCNGTDKSSWVGSGTFTTQILVATPYSEPFTTTTTPSGWGITGWTIGSIRGVTGNPGNNIYKNLYASATTGTFTTVNVGPISSGQLLTFDWKTADYTSFAAPGVGTGDFVVSISTDWGATYTTINTTSTGANNTWNAYSYNLSSYAGQNVKIRIVGNWVSGDYDLAFDNFKIETPPSCLPPTITATTSIAATTASINWTAPGTAPSNGYQWEVRSSGAGGSGGAGLVASGTVAAGVLTASVTGLAASTGYTVYVRSDCGGSGFSTWASGGAFTTLCNPVSSFPYLMPFDGSASCWTVSSSTPTWTLVASSADISSPQSGSGFMHKAYTTSSAYLFSPAIDLSTFGTNQARLKFYIYRNSSTVASDSISFKINTSATNTGATVLQSY